MSRPRKKVLLFCDGDEGLAGELRLILETRLHVATFHARDKAEIATLVGMGLEAAVVCSTTLLGTTIAELLHERGLRVVRPVTNLKLDGGLHVPPVTRSTMIESVQYAIRSKRGPVSAAIRERMQWEAA